MIEGKQVVSPNGTFRRLFRARCRKSAKANCLLEAIAKASREGTGFVSHSEENGVVRIKMVVKKTDLAQVLEAMGGGGGDGGGGGGVAAASVSIEQRLAIVRRKQLLRAKLAAATWSPALQSIPEEIDSF
ncbi:hypothetical protein E5676_scaffold3037G00200 [Cucumis melo var. makuwa]|uniref:Uncharacterized protein n=2 Tax=Cucumis melo TaxID=3656 RepID=A0A5A7SHL7_CUCMM|nr:hypothetical protein E6C27_scaffold124G00220 [Cucumis melo var. makuwa]TYK19366.1 hypothetical protein E5676_scaffold3037G00200 [Cucumis melo var. makuwa]